MRWVPSEGPLLSPVFGYSGSSAIGIKQGSAEPHRSGVNVRGPHRFIPGLEPRSTDFIPTTQYKVPGWGFHCQPNGDVRTALTFFPRVWFWYYSGIHSSIEAVWLSKKSTQYLSVWKCGMYKIVTPPQRQVVLSDSFVFVKSLLIFFSKPFNFSRVSFEMGKKDQ